ncbi:MAG: hypothetical protein IJE97_15535 [Thermoguttaceae bacterium]|nr:hypothetical protein [Thermoguttaceae bacterium]
MLEEVILDIVIGGLATLAVASHLQARRRKFKRYLKFASRWQRRRKKLRVAVKWFRKLARVNKTYDEVDISVGLNFFAQAVRAKEEAAFQAALTSAENYFYAAARSAENLSATTALVAAAIAAFYRNERRRATDILAFAATSVVFVEEANCWGNRTNYLKFLLLKDQIAWFLADAKACETYNDYKKYKKYWKPHMELFEAWRNYYRNLARESQGQDARRFRIAARQANKLRRLIKYCVKANYGTIRLGLCLASR